MEILIKPIAYVTNSRTELKDDFWGNIISEITLTDDFSKEALDGIEEFSHLEIIFHFHKADIKNTVWHSEHPRENPNYPKVGIFAQRKKNRPNLIGTTIVKLIKVEGKTISVKNFDAIDGTPVIDIKPVMKEFLPKETIHQPEWSSDLMKDYW